MKPCQPVFLAASLFLLMSMTMGVPTSVHAHCDGLDGPVVTLAKEALDNGNVNRVLPWVPQDAEPEIRRAFDHTRSVRQLGPEAKALADTFFFETVVRLHRAAEGAPFTGLKPVGRELGPALPAADQALESGSIAAVEKLLTGAIHHGLHQHFDAVMTHKKFDPNEVAAGRRYVAAYVSYVHYVEGLWQAATQSAEGHYPETAVHPH